MRVNALRQVAQTGALPSEQAEEERRRQVLWSAAQFQPQQVGVADLHEMVQRDAVRAPLEQARFEQQMRAFERLIQEAGGITQAIQQLNQSMAGVGLAGYSSGLRPA